MVKIIMYYLYVLTNNQIFLLTTEQKKELDEVLETYYTNKVFQEHICNFQIYKISVEVYKVLKDLSLELLSSINDIPKKYKYFLLLKKNKLKLITYSEIKKSQINKLIGIEKDTYLSLKQLIIN